MRRIPRWAGDGSTGATPIPHPPSNDAGVRFPNGNAPSACSLIVPFEVVAIRSGIGNTKESSQAVRERPSLQFYRPARAVSVVDASVGLGLSLIGTLLVVIGTPRIPERIA